jgi:AcrR family transcriptional regulator
VTTAPVGDKRAQVIEAAIRIFSDRGYRRTSMWDIAREVNLSKPALYHYVSSKEALLVEIYERATVEGLEAAKRMLEHELPPLESLREMLVDRVVYTCEHQRLFRILFEEEAEIPEDLMDSMRVHRREYEDLIIGVLQRGVDDGSIHFETTPRIVVNVLLGAAHWSYKWFNPGGSKATRQLAEEMVEVLLDGLKTRPSAA